MAVPGEQESFKSQSFSSPKRTTSIPSGAADANRRLAAERQQTREKFFDNRQDVSTNRLDRRLTQAQEYEKFKADPTKTKLVGGTTNLFQAATPGGKTLAQKEMELAQKYGPTLREIGGDFMYGLGQFTSDLGERAMSGSLGIFGAIKDVANYAFNKANQSYDKLNSVQQEIFDNPDKYPYASKVPQVEAVNNSRQLALEADRDALGLELDALMAEREFRYNNPTVDMRKPTREGLEAIDIDGSYVESGQFKSDLEKSGIITVDDPSTQEPLADSTKIPGTNTTLGDLKEELKKQNYNDFQITGIINEMTRRIISGEDVNAPIENIGEPENVKQDNIQIKDGEATSITNEEFQEKEKKVNEIFKEDDFFSQSFTPYDNPFNLEFRGQEGAEPGYGGPEGDRFAKFADLDTGIKAGVSRIAEIANDKKTTKGFLDVYAPKEDNPNTYDSYLANLENVVGPTIEPDEIEDLSKAIIRQENTRDLADKYLNYLEQEKDKIYSGIVS